ncbi:hypothetical protein CFSAN002367_26336 [Clostridium botulinum CFSAN002367]|nr:hypothetical protein CFSAN002367_26336 [Clostridium botulinum CFSAN002367]EPS49182.1 hypothetical protein CFSAN002369_13355 [Clostridium botulinum CFSAN002369]
MIKFLEREYTMPTLPQPIVILLVLFPIIYLSYNAWKEKIIRKNKILFLVHPQQLIFYHIIQA